MSDNNELMQIVKQTAYNVAGVSEQMGILHNEVNSLKLEMRRQVEGLQAVNDRMQNYEDRIRLTRSQAQNVRNSIHKRVKDLLDIRYVNDVVATECLYDDKYYRPGFISRLYADARKYSKLGTPYQETYQRDYAEVLEYINLWQPPTGTDGYKAYLDARRKE